jgi:hypothetical protein
MKIQFRTSKGIVEGTVEANGLITVDDRSAQILKKLYGYSSVSLTDGWVTIDLEDGYYGYPEYQPQTFTDEEVKQSRENFAFET